MLWPDLDSDASHIHHIPRMLDAILKINIYTKTAASLSFLLKFRVPTVKQTQAVSRQNDFYRPLSQFFQSVSPFVSPSAVEPTASALRTVSSVRIWFDFLSSKTILNSHMLRYCSLPLWSKWYLRSLFIFKKPKPLTVACETSQHSAGAVLKMPVFLTKWHLRRGQKINVFPYELNKIEVGYK